MAATRSNHSKPGFVRIIGGKWRRRRITVADSMNLRPTPDRVRETLFNWLEPMPGGARCLDLFAGTGSLGFEALSRGAGEVVFVEREIRAAKALETVCRELDADAEIVCADAAEYLARPLIGRFDVVFVDPPYAAGVTSILEALTAVLDPRARVYLERERADSWPALPGLTWVRRATAGAVEFGLAKRAD